MLIKKLHAAMITAILLFCTTSCTHSTGNFNSQNSELEEKINSIVNGKKATVAVSVLAFEDNLNYNKNGDRTLPMQSVFKFYIAATVLNEVDQDKLSLSQKISLNKSNLHENTWSPLREKYPNGADVSLSEIIEQTVAFSDNNGCDILLDLIGGTQAVQNFMNSKGVTDFQIKFNEEEMHKDWNAQYQNSTTTNSANQTLKKFYNKKLLSKSSTDFLMEIMLGTTLSTNKIVEQLPKGTPAARKTGASGKNQDGLTGAENEIAIITLPNGRHYAISVFVSDSMEENNVNFRMISDISKVVWDYFNNKQKF